MGPRYLPRLSVNEAALQILPPLATAVADDEALRLIQDWIAAMKE